MQVPEKLINFRVYEDGADLIGIADVDMPTLTAMTETVKGAGIAGEIDAPATGHMGSMEVTFNWRTLNKSNVYLMAPKAFTFDLRGAQDVYDSANRTIRQQPIKVVVVGRPKELSVGKLDVNASTGTSNKMEVLYIKVTVDGDDLLEYDKYNYIYKVGSTDYLAQMREALGLV